MSTWNLLKVFCRKIINSQTVLVVSYGKRKNILLCLAVLPCNKFKLMNHILCHFTSHLAETLTKLQLIFKFILFKHCSGPKFYNICLLFNQQLMCVKENFITLTERGLSLSAKKSVQKSNFIKCKQYILPLNHKSVSNIRHEDLFRPFVRS